MRTPSPWEFALLVLAGFRIWKLLAEDEILHRPREWFLARPRDARWPWRRGGPRKWSYWRAFLDCPFCLGFWVAVVLWALWLATPTGSIAVAIPFALSAGVGLLADAWGSLAD